MTSNKSYLDRFINTITKAGFNVLVIIHPNEDLINSIWIAVDFQPNSFDSFSTSPSFNHITGYELNTILENEFHDEVALLETINRFVAAEGIKKMKFSLNLIWKNYLPLTS